MTETNTNSDKNKKSVFLFFDLLPDPVCLLDEDDRLLEVNKAASELFIRGDIHPFAGMKKKQFLTESGLFFPFPFYRAFPVTWEEGSVRQLVILKRVPLFDSAQTNWFRARRDRELVDFFREEGFCDPLTDLPNRRAIWGYYEVCAQSGILLFFDINNFKQMNDVYGHLLGDFVLSEVARELIRTFPAPCLPGRFGGDEFLVVCPQVAVSAIERRAVNISMPKILAGADSLHFEEKQNEEDRPALRLNFGMTEYSGDEDFETVLRRTDEDLYRRKSDPFAFQSPTVTLNGVLRPN